MSITDLHTPTSTSTRSRSSDNSTLDNRLTQTVTNDDELTAQVIRLTNKKDDIQTSIESYINVLQTNKSDMSTQLIDNEGFPRSDIDVAAVRTARVNIIRLRNDLEQVRKDMATLVERGLPRTTTTSAAQQDGHGDVQASREQDRQRMNVDEDNVQSTLRRTAFARVDGVFPGGPADNAGLKRQDLIVSIGSITILNHDRLRAVGRLVNTSEGVTLPVVILRPTAFKSDREELQQLHLRLTPRSGWGGRGLLGCHIVPTTA
ncbi:putative 26S proteasome regulatory subunit [Microbotryomycetes sp. JL221]|nr:putative 26S proteasome regulatory subunit [Microbotryomycetes sp. JL221]